MLLMNAMAATVMCYDIEYALIGAYDLYLCGHIGVNEYDMYCELLYWSE